VNDTFNVTPRRTSDASVCVNPYEMDGAIINDEFAASPSVDGKFSFGSTNAWQRFSTRRVHLPLHVTSSSLPRTDAATACRFDSL
jgi:hypothetical protein